MHTVKRCYAYSPVINVRINKVLLIIIVVALTVSLTLDVAAVEWLSVYKRKNLSWNDTNKCKDIKKQYSLTKQQTKLCNKSTDVMPHVQEAANLVVGTCEILFRTRRWNCSSLKNLPEIKADLVVGTKERAAVHAMSTAALTYTISRGCSRSSINGCGCSAHPNEPPNDNFKWGGCGDNVQWASSFSKQFDSNKKTKKKPRTVSKTQQKSVHSRDNYVEKDRDANDDDNDVQGQNASLLEIVHNHNGEIGRKLVSNSLSVTCKCHGISGSCSIKTCWRGLPLKFNEIGEKVMSAYNTAVQVQPTLSKAEIMKRYSQEQCLLYTTNSPNYCDYNPKLGTYGTSGRQCSANSNPAENCDSLCCGRGYQSRIVEYFEQCRCVYRQDLVNVVCEKCKHNKTINTCN